MNVKAKIASGIFGASAIAAVSLIMPFEGKSNVPYYDPPGILTICYGHTKNVKLGQFASDEDCYQMLEDDLRYFNNVLDKNIKVNISQTTRAALLSFVYNVGEGNFKSSTLLKKLNSGDIEGACNELTRWIYAGGKVLNGLINRRKAEKELCLQRYMIGGGFFTHPIGAGLVIIPPTVGAEISIKGFVDLKYNLIGHKDNHNITVKIEQRP